VWLEVIRRKDFYVLLVLSGALLLTLASVSILGMGGIAGYVKDVGLLMAWLFGWILAIGAATRELPEEETRGTVFPLLAKPVRRVELVAGKWLGVWTAVAAAVFVFYLLVFFVAWMRGSRMGVAEILQGYILHAGALGVLCALGIALSTRTNRDAAGSLGYVLSAAAFALAPRIPEFLAREQGFRGHALAALYYLLPHFELFDMRKRMIHGYGPMRWDVFAGVCVYGCVLTQLLLLLAWIGYRNKRFARGNLSL
jgi:ABC-type Na+ efflux pump permease subunit